MSSAKPASQKLENVILLKDHTHAGVRYKKDAAIQVNAADKAWLIANGIVAAPAATAPATAGN